MEVELFVDCWPPYRGKYGLHQGRLNVFCKCVRREAKGARKPYYDWKAGKCQEPIVHVVATLHEDNKMQALDDLKRYADAVRRAMIDAHVVDNESQVHSVLVERAKSNEMTARGCTLRIVFEGYNG